MLEGIIHKSWTSKTKSLYNSRYIIYCTSILGWWSILYKHHWTSQARLLQLNKWMALLLVTGSKHLFSLYGWLTWWPCWWLQKEKPGNAVTQMHHPIPSTSPVPPDAQLFICYVAGIHYLSGIFSFITQINSVYFFLSLGKIVNGLVVPTVSWYSLILFMIPFMIKSRPYPSQDKVSTHEYFTSIT